MKPQAYQIPELRDENDNIIQKGTFSIKNDRIYTEDNNGTLDYIVNNLEALRKKADEVSAKVSSNKDEIDESLEDINTKIDNRSVIHFAVIDGVLSLVSE